MGLANWLNELSPARRLGVALATGAAVCASAYGLYVYLAKRTDGGERRAGPDDEIPERRILVLGLDGAGKSTFLGALAQQNAVSPPSPQPTEGFHVICITTEGFKLNIWESRYLSCEPNQTVLGQFRPFDCLLLDTCCLDQLDLSPIFTHTNPQVKWLTEKIS